MKKIKVSPKIVENIFKKGLNPASETIMGIPDNYSLVGCEFNNHERIITLFFDLEEIEEVYPEFMRLK